ncbi:MAG: DUF1385 domain-containing protein [Deltaproteobacteria bacterium]|nr:DUF1385 domain-containing protein [Deltaproteobacteria bacterium]MBW2306299.1 DUF1385 domain-containing protein [Deltaproteobacteria bacterium]
MSEKIQVGGQAVIEGVMMRTQGSLSVVIRKRNGEMKIKRERLVSVVERMPFLGKPFFRGVVVLVEALIKGIQALMYSAQQNMEDEAGEAANSPDKAKDRWAMGIFVAIGAGVGILFFVVIPHVLTLIMGRVGNTDMGVETVRFHVVDGVLKLAFFILYIRTISLMKDIRRVFQYHGAEHKSIHAYEAGQPLTLEGAMPFPTIHPHCGTAFILLVLTLSIIVFSALFPMVPLFRTLGRYEIHLAIMVIKILLFVPIAGISYEIIKLADRRPRNLILQALTRPGLWLQSMTTREPTAEQLEVALTALKSTLEMEQNRCDLPFREGKDVR